MSTSTDLLVVGSGTGLAAALAAHEHGLSVLVVEKSNSPRHRARHLAGFMACCPAVRRNLAMVQMVDALQIVPHVVFHCLIVTTSTQVGAGSGPGSRSL